MAKYTGPKCKQCRRLNVKLCTKGERGLSAKCALTKRNYPPGVHGNKGYPRLTDYGQHLQEKQKIKVTYGVMERQLRKYFDEAVRSQTDTGFKLIELLERRLDNVIYRLGLASSRPQARQFVSHSLFKINNPSAKLPSTTLGAGRTSKKIDVPSCRVKPGDVITIRKDKSKKKGFLAEALSKIEKHERPSWLEWDNKEQKAKVVGIPKGKDLEIGIDPRLIVEFYSK